MKRDHTFARAPRSDQGLAMLAAVMCLLVVVTITAVAVQQSIGGLSGFAQGRKLLQTVDAAEAGVQSEISAVQHWLSSPGSTVPCQGGTPITSLPSGQGWLPASSSSADSVVNAASLGYYTLSLATFTSQPSPPSGELPATDACYNNSIAAPTGTPSWYLIVQAKGITSATTGGSTATGRTLQALLLIHDYSLAAYHGSVSHPRPANSIHLVAFYSGGSTTYTSNASAQAYNVTALETPLLTAPVNPTPTTASYSGYGPPDPNQVSSSQPAPSILNGESWLTAGNLAQYAEADSSGTSSSCAGLVASPGSILPGSSNSTCSPSGSPGSTGVTFDLSTIPAVGTAISSVADVKLETSSITSYASMGTGGSPANGGASLGNLYVRVAVPLGPTVTLAISGSGVDQNLMTSITSAINADAAVIGPVTATLVAALNSALALTSNYQTTSGGVFSVSAIHVTALGSGATGDIALSTVGTNTVTPGSPSSTTTVPSTTTTVPSGTTTTVPSGTTTTVPSGTTTTVPSGTTTTTVPPNNLSIVWVRQVA